MRFWQVLAAIWTAFFAVLALAATVSAGTAVSNLASWAELFHLYDLVPYLTKNLDSISRWIGLAATVMGILWNSILIHENRAWFKRQYEKIRARLLQT
jgi:hypothetical protein